MPVVACGGNAVNDVFVEGGDLNITQTVNHYETKPSFAVPRELPKSGEVFDRKEETRIFEESVGRGVDVVFIKGAPGIGKTTCLIKWANSLKKSYTDGQLFIDASQYRERGVFSPRALQIRAAAACGCDPAQLKNCADPAALYRSLTAEKRMLIVIDNVIDRLEIEALIPNSDESLVMAAGQMSLAFPFHGVPISVERFEESDSVGYLHAVVVQNSKETIWKAFSPEALMKIVRKCDGVPIVLRQAATLLSEGVYAPEDIVEKMEHDPGLGALTPLLDACVSELNSETKFLYCFLGSINAGDVWATSVENMLSSLEGGDPRSQVALLKRGSLIEFEPSTSLGSVGERIKMHRQIRHHARSLVSRGCVDLRAAIKAYVRFYRGFVQEIDYAQSPERLRLFKKMPVHSDFSKIGPENANELFLGHFNEFFCVVETALDYELYDDAGAIAESLWVFYYENGMLYRGLPVFEDGLKASRCLGDRDAEARMLSLVSRCHLFFGDSAQAKDDMDLAHQAAINSRDWVLKGSLCESSGDVARFDRDYECALDWYSRANEEYLKTGDECHRGIVISEIASAQCHLLSGRSGAALGVLGSLEERVPDNIDGVTLVKILACKGTALEAEGRFADALSALDAAVAKCKEGGLTLRGGEARMQSARIHQKNGERNAAKCDYLEAADFFLKAGLLKDADRAKSLAESSD